jgi:hypothetical protein
MTGDQRSDSELLARLPRQPELTGLLYDGCTEYGVAYAYVSEGPATSAPAVP